MKAGLHLTVSSALSEGYERLAHIESAKIDAQLLLAHVMDVDRTALFTWPEKPLSDTQVQAFDACLEKRAVHYPVAYLRQQQAFWSLDFFVNDDVLIPRPETELLVEQALFYIQTKDKGVQRILDLGTGSGAIACSLAKNCPDAFFLGVDASYPALKVAGKNVAGLGLGNVSLVLSRWFDGLSGTFDMIVSNPPYIAEEDPHLTQGDVRHEPRSALVSGEKGMGAIQEICRLAPAYLGSDGHLLIEHGWEQGQAVRDCFHLNGFLEIESVRDLAGNERVTHGKLRG